MLGITLYIVTAASLILILAKPDCMKFLKRPTRLKGFALWFIWIFVAVTLYSETQEAKDIIAHNKARKAKLDSAHNAKTIKTHKEYSDNDTDYSYEYFDDSCDNINVDNNYYDYSRLHNDIRFYPIQYKLYKKYQNKNK